MNNDDGADVQTATDYTNDRLDANFQKADSDDLPVTEDTTQTDQADPTEVVNNESTPEQQPTVETRAYRLGSSPLIFAPGMLMNYQYQAKTDFAQAIQLFAGTWPPVPVGDAVKMLLGQCAITIEDDVAVVIVLA
jgi:hypothetical protein